MPAAASVPGIPDNLTSVNGRKPFDEAEFQAALDRTISCLTLARQNAALRRHLGTEK